MCPKGDSDTHGRELHVAEMKTQATAAHFPGPSPRKRVSWRPHVGGGREAEPDLLDGELHAAGVGWWRQERHVFLQVIRLHSFILRNTEHPELLLRDGKGYFFPGEESDGKRFCNLPEVSQLVSRISDRIKVFCFLLDSIFHLTEHFKLPKKSHNQYYRNPSSNKQHCENS